MNYEELKRDIQNSEKSDWLCDNHKGIFTFKKDLNVTIRREYFDDSTFHVEEWADKFFKPAARLMYEIYYGVSFVEGLYFVNLDKNRAEVPLPTLSPELKINKYQYAVAKIINVTGSLDGYLEQANITVE